MQLPPLVVNAKAYPEATGRERVLALARSLEAACEQAGAKAALAVPHLELATVGRFAGLRHVLVLAQHVDPAKPGAATGSVTAEAVAEAGAKGSLLNHAERKVPKDALAGAHARLQELRLLQVVCADGLEELRHVCALRPTAVAIEPPELIGGDVSVTSADPKVVADAVAETGRLAKGTLALCGAGVKSGADVAKARELGAYGVLVASGVVKAEDPAAALLDLARGL
jgi:triosephosphate isomerase (TIM)